MLTKIWGRIPFWVRPMGHRSDRILPKGVSLIVQLSVGNVVEWDIMPVFVALPKMGPLLGRNQLTRPLKKKSVTKIFFLIIHGLMTVGGTRENSTKIENVIISLMNHDPSKVGSQIKGTMSPRLRIRSKNLKLTQMWSNC